jgi:EmrB/QacA subfamily drug resistance transporter
MTSTEQSAPRGAAAAPDPRRWKALWICLAAGFITLLDVSIVNVALPSMEHGVGATPSDVSWVVSGYALTFGLALVPAGRLGDDYGRKRLFMLGLLLFVATSALCGAAQNAEWLVIARLGQGVAGGLLSPQVIGIIQQLFSGRERGKAFGLFGATIGVSTAIGPLLGGLLIQAFGVDQGWRYVFFVNLPIGLIALAFATRLLPGDRRTDQRQAPDLLGTVLLGLAVVSVMLPLIEEEDQSANPRWWLMGVGGALLIVFVLWERWLDRRGRHPLVRLKLLTIPSYAMGSLLGLVYFAGFTGIFLIVTLYFQQGLGYSPLQAGASTLAFAVGSAISPTIGGRFVHRFGRSMVTIGILAATVGIAVTAFLAHEWTGANAAVVLAGPLFVAGFGSGLVIAPNQTLALEEIPPAEGGTAAGVLQTAQRVGSAVGTALAGSLFFGELDRSRGNFHTSAALGLFGAAGLVALALVIAIVDLVLGARRRRAQAAASPQQTDERPEDVPAEAVEAPPARLPALGGRVTDPVGRVVSAVLTLTTAGGRQVARARTDSDGRFALDAGPGAYLLLVTAPGLEPSVREIRLNGEPVTADTTLSGTAGLSGVVSGGFGPVAGARVTLLDQEGEVRHATTTDTDGRYRFADVRSGEYTVIASGHPPTTSSLHIAAGDHVQHDALL